MTECNFCNDNVSMPYTCSLCSNRHCSKHRLPESHNCSNIGHFKTDAYRKLKIEKSRLPMNTITIRDTYGGSMYGGRPGTWTSGSVVKDVAIAGLIIGLVSVLRDFIDNQDFLVVFGGFIYGIIGLYVIYIWRDVFARKYEIITVFVLWPIGIAITIVTAFFPIFRFIFFGYFVNEDSDSLKSEGMLGIVSTISILIIYSLGKIIAYTFSNAIFIGFSLASDVFFFFAIINVLPFNLFDGKRIWDWDRSNYIMTVAFIIIVYYIINNIFV